MNPIRKAAYSGNAEAQFELGQIYEKKKNYRRSKYWYEKACSQDYAEGCLALANCYSVKTEVSLKKELALLLKAYKLGSLIAADNLAFYYKNKGDYRQFKKWLEKSIKRWTNNGEALFELARYYYEGLGGKKAYKKSYEIFNKALKTKNISVFTREEIFFNLGKMYFSGHYVKRSLPKAKYLFSKANVDNDHIDVYKFTNENAQVLAGIKEQKFNVYSVSRVCSKTRV